MERKMKWNEYEYKFRLKAKSEGKSETYISKWLEYSKNLVDKGLTIILSQSHFCYLVGYKPAYVYAVSNSSDKFYRCFSIPKKNGGERLISEPLPNLKEIQHWILTNVLEKMETSPYAKAYIKGKTIKDNARFHRGQKKLLSLDIENFFDSISGWYVFKVFEEAGYSKPVAKLLAQLCTKKNRLPQGAPTSAMLSNIVMKDFDRTIGRYCGNRKIRYTRYADDLAFSGDFDERILISAVKKELRKMNLSLNSSKTRVRVQGQQQEVTGVVVNEKMQTTKAERRIIRQEIYYIQKFGLQSHVSRIGKEQSNYIDHLLGRISYSLFINPNDCEMKEYKSFMVQQKKLLCKNKKE